MNCDRQHVLTSSVMYHVVSAYDAATPGTMIEFRTLLTAQQIHDSWLLLIGTHACEHCNNSWETNVLWLHLHVFTF